MVQILWEKKVVKPGKMTCVLSISHSMLLGLQHKGKLENGRKKINASFAIAKD